MGQDDDPLISIVTVNFNGRDFLKNLFNSIHNLNYPAKKIQMIMVDNNSTDGSVEYVKKEFPWVEVVALKENKGYAGGNNEGFKNSSGRYIALINNDCTVEKDWLIEMLSIFRQSTENSRIGAVGSRVVFYYSYLPFQLITSSISVVEQRSRRARRLGIKIYEPVIRFSRGDKNSGKSLSQHIRYLDGFYSAEADNKGKIYHWTNDNAILAVPVADSGSDMELEFKVCSYISPNNLQLVAGEEIIKDMEVSKKIKTVKIKIPERLFVNCKDIINSCGIKINKSFYSRDRGFESLDEGQYNRVEEIFGLSGSSFMVDRKMLEETGYFDESFFTYYEDIDLFWRARLAGWKNFFTPKSVARHLHCGTGKEWSYNFTYHVIRNRLIMIFKCGWMLLFIRCYLAFVVSGLIHLLYYLAAILRGSKQKRVDIPARIRVFFELFYLLPKNFIKRIRIRTSSKVKDKIIKSWIKSF